MTPISSAASRASQTRVGDHHRDDVADVVGFLGRHHRIGLQRRLRPIGVGDRSKAGQIAEIGEIADDVDGSDAGRRARGFEIVDAEFCMPIGTAQKNRFEFGIVDRVGCVIAPAADQTNVLDALNALTYPEFCRPHIVSIPSAV